MAGKMGTRTIAYFRDQFGKVGHLYGATATPDLFVVKADGDLASKDAIDSIPAAMRAKFPAPKIM